MSNDFQDDPPALIGIFVRRVLLHGQDVSLDAQLSKISDGGLKKLEERDRQAQSDVKQLHQWEVKDLKATVKDVAAKHPPP